MQALINGGIMGFNKNNKKGKRFWHDYCSI
jgi:hypothetical protein